MRQIAKKGDMALVIGVTESTGPDPTRANGKVVEVLSDPFPHEWFGTRTANLCRLDGARGLIATDRLVPIRDPDADVSTELSQEVAA